MSLRRWGVLLGALLGLSLPATLSAQELRRFGLFVGHNDGGKQTRRLLYAEEDARRMQETHERLGSVERRYSRLLKAPSRAQLLASLNALTSQVQAAQRQGARVVLTFYYAGHADQDALLLAGVRLERELLLSALRKTGAELRLIFIDACQSGAFTRARGGARAPAFLTTVETGEQLRGEAIVTSSTADELSQESDAVGGGYFTHHLLVGLQGAADSSRDGQVTLDELYHYAYHQTLFETAGSVTGIQHPSIQTELRGHGSLVISHPAQGQTQLVLPSGLRGQTLIFDKDRKRLVAELNLSGAEAHPLFLPAGRYVIQQREPDHLLVTEVTLTRGKTHELDTTTLTRAGFSADISRGLAQQHRQRGWQPELSLAVQSGYQRMFAQPSGVPLYPDLPWIGLELAFRAPRLEPLQLSLDGAWGAQQTTLEVAGYQLPLQYRFQRYGLGLRYGLRWENWSAFAGFHLESLIFERRDLNTQDPAELSWTTAPGVQLGGAYAFSPHWSVGLQAQGHYLHYLTDTASLSLGHLDFMVKFNRRF